MFLDKLFSEKSSMHNCQVHFCQFALVSESSLMKILLLYPQYPETFWSLTHALDLMGKKAAIPPLGLLTIASLIEDGNELKLIDMNVKQLNDEDILWADYVFISAMITQKDSTVSTISRCKELEKKIAAGGPLFNNLYSEFPEVDNFILNEGETVIPKFLQDLKNGNPKKIYTSEIRPDINLVPVPKWDLIDLNDYARMALQFSRGCPFDCEFCDIVNLNGREPRVKTTEQFIKELNSLYDRGWRSSIFIIDDNFIGNKTQAKILLRKLIEWRKEKRYKWSFMTQISLNLAGDDELLVLMQKAGFSTVFIGIETPSKNSLEECGKFHNQNRDMVQDVKKIYNYGMEIYGGFIIGFDHDDETIFNTQFEFIQETGIVVAMMGLLTALPGTRLYKRLKNENRLTKESGGNNIDLDMNFIPKMNKEILISEYKKLLIKLYSVENYYARIFNFLKEYKHHTDDKLTKNFGLGFLKCLYILGIQDKSRFYFWKMFFTCVFKHPKSLSKVLTQAIYFAHFEKFFLEGICKINEEEKEFSSTSVSILTSNT